jgi:hypothetical protein
MHAPSILRRALGLPGRIGLLLGLGALSATVAKADIGQACPGPAPDSVPQQSVRTFGDMLIWTEDGRIYVSESGGARRELALSETPQAHRLRQLLKRDGATTESPRVLQDRIILVGGGGEGFHWAPMRRPEQPGKTNPSSLRDPPPESERPAMPPRGAAQATPKPDSTRK